MDYIFLFLLRDPCFRNWVTQSSERHTPKGNAQVIMQFQQNGLHFSFLTLWPMFPELGLIVWKGVPWVTQPFLNTVLFKWSSAQRFQNQVTLELNIYVKWRRRMLRKWRNGGRNKRWKVETNQNGTTASVRRIRFRTSDKREQHWRLKEPVSSSAV